MDTSTIKPVSLKWILSVLLATVVTGCATPTPKLDDNFGNAVNAAKAAQIINPDASLNTDPVAGLDGQAADAAMSRYHRSFVQPATTPNVFNIGVSSGASGMTSGGAGAGGGSGGGSYR
jgi:hypothetical protein